LKFKKLFEHNAEMTGGNWIKNTSTSVWHSCCSSVVAL